MRSRPGQNPSMDGARVILDELRMEELPRSLFAALISPSAPEALFRNHTGVLYYSPIRSQHEAKLARLWFFVPLRCNSRGMGDSEEVALVGRLWCNFAAVCSFLACEGSDCVDNGVEVRNYLKELMENGTHILIFHHPSTDHTSGAHSHFRLEWIRNL